MPIGPKNLATPPKSGPNDVNILLTPLKLPINLPIAPIIFKGTLNTFFILPNTPVILPLTLNIWLNPLNIPETLPPILPIPLPIFAKIENLLVIFSTMPAVFKKPFAIEPTPFPIEPTTLPIV